MAVPDETLGPQRDREKAQAAPAQVDLGFTCWIQVVGSWALSLNTLGLINSYGQFQTYYERTLPESPSQIAWIGSIQSFLLFFIGILSAPLMNAGHSRLPLAAGSFLIVFGLMMTSLGTKYWHFVLAQGVVMGLGFGILFLPSISVLVHYFVAKRSFALSVATTASGFGGVIYPIIFHRLVPRIGFGWTVRIIAFMTLFFALLSVAIVRSRATPTARPADAAAAFARNFPLLALTAGYFLIFVAVYVPTVYIGSFALATGATSSTEMAFYLLPILMASGIFGRLLLGRLADVVGPLTLCTFATFAATVLAAGWIGAVTQSGTIAFAVLYGFFQGVILSLPSPCVAVLASPQFFNVHLGFASMIISFGVLIGTPVAGAVLRSSSGFRGLQAFTVAVLGTATVLLAVSRVGKAGLRLVKV